MTPDIRAERFFLVAACPWLFIPSIEQGPA